MCLYILSLCFFSPAANIKCWHSTPLQTKATSKCSRFICIRSTYLHTWELCQTAAEQKTTVRDRVSTKPLDVFSKTISCCVCVKRTRFFKPKHDIFPIPGKVFFVWLSQHEMQNFTLWEEKLRYEETYKFHHIKRKDSTYRRLFWLGWFFLYLLLDEKFTLKWRCYLHPRQFSGAATVKNFGSKML